MLVYREVNKIKEFKVDQEQTDGLDDIRIAKRMLQIKDN